MIKFHYQDDCIVEKIHKGFITLLEVARSTLNGPKFDFRINRITLFFANTKDLYITYMTENSYRLGK